MSKINFNMLINISKNIIKGLFPYFFSNYFPSKLNIENTKGNVEVNKFNNICSKTKKKLMYSINPNNVLESLWLLDYKTKNIQNERYKFKIGVNNYLPKTIYECNNKSQIIIPKLNKSLRSSSFYNSNLKNKMLNLKKQQRLLQENYNFECNKNKRFDKNKVNKFNKYNNISYK